MSRIIRKGCRIVENEFSKLVYGGQSHGLISRRGGLRVGFEDNYIDDGEFQA